MSARRLDPAQTILMIAPRPGLVSAARAMGLAPLVVHSPAYLRAEHCEHAEAVRAVDYTNSEQLAAVLDELSRTFGIDAVVSNTEPGLIPAGVAADHLGLPGLSAATHARVRNKVAMRTHLESVGVSQIRWAAVNDKASLITGLAQVRTPAILKPADGSASLGVAPINGTKDVDIWAALAHIDAISDPSGRRYSDILPITGWILEERLCGPEYSIETFAADGRITTYAIVAKRTSNHFVELGHLAPACIDDDLADAIRGEATVVLAALGLRDGPAHTEVACDSQGRPRLIETHTRTGGDRIVELVEAVTGCNLECLSVSWAARLGPPPAALPARGGAATRFLTGPAGIVTNVEGVEAARAVNGVVSVTIDVAAGSILKPTRSSWDRLGQIIAVAASAAEAEEVCEHAAALVRVLVDAMGPQ